MNRPEAPIPHSLDGLGEDARQGLEMLCIATLTDASGRGIPRPDADALGHPFTAAWLDELRGAGLVTIVRAEADVHVRVVSVEVVQHVLERMTLQRQEQLHRRAGQRFAHPRGLLHRTYLLDAGADTADECERAARDLGQAGQWVQAADLFRRSAQLSPPAQSRERLMAAADAWCSAGDMHSAATLAHEVEKLETSAMRDAIVGYVAVQTGASTVAARRLAHAWKNTNPRTDPATASVVAHRSALDALARWDGAAVVSWAQQALALAEPDSPIAREAKAFLGVGYVACGDAEQGLAVSVDEVKLTGPDGPLSQRAHLGLGWVRMARGELDQAYDAFARARLLGSSGGSVRGALWAMGWQARLALEFGALQEAAATAGAARKLAQTSGLTLGEPLAVWTLAEVAALRGDGQAARRIARSLHLPSDAYPVQRVPAALAQAAAVTAQGPTSVLACLAQLRQDAPLRSLTPDVWGWQPRAALALAQTGRAADAERLIADMGQPRSALVQAQTTLVEAVVASNDRYEAGQEAFERTRTLAGATRGVLTLALADFAESVALRRHGLRNDAKEVARQASVAFENMGVRVYAEALGDVADTAPSADALASLSAQERAVARLVVQGMTNPQVAETLFISVKTVQFHLTRVYAKLGVSGRTELAASYSADLT